MRFLPLICAGLWRRPARSILTLLCILTAFLLLWLLEGVNAGFAKAIEDAHRDLLVTNTRVRGGAPMPISVDNGFSPIVLLSHIFSAPC